jgi:hypothetical protein
VNTGEILNQMILQNELFNYWVLKESYMKYTGLEFHLKLESFTTIIENNDKNNIKFNSFDVENYKIAFACNQSTKKILDMMWKNYIRIYNLKTIFRFAEEIYTRGWIIPLFSKNYSVFVAILVSTLFFVVGHVGNNGFNVVSIISLILFSILLSLLFLKADNIWICGALHSAWNFTQSYLFGFNVSGIDTSSILHFGQTTPNIINGGVYGPEAGLISLVITFLAIIFVWKVDINKKLF